MSNLTGNSVSNGYFDYEEGELVVDFLKKLSFSNDIYPFFFVISQDSGAGLQTEYFNLSLADPISYENIKLAQNVNIQFFSKDQIINEETNLPKDRITSLTIGGRNLSIPLAGRITAQILYDYLGFNIEIDSSNASVATREEIELNSFSKPFDANEILSITLPPRQNQFLTVSISGNIASPGTYVLPLQTTVNDLYEIAGGFLEGASSKGIILARESIKGFKKDVLTKIHGGGAVDRKRKLLEKQKKGKARAKQFGKVEIPQEAFIGVLRINKD